MNSSEARDIKTRQRLEQTKQTLRKLSPHPRRDTHPILIQTLHSSTKLYSLIKTRKKSKTKNKPCSFTSRFFFLTYRSRATGRPEETAAETLYEGKPCLLLLVCIHSKTNWSQVVRRREVSCPLETEERRGERTGGGWRRREGRGGSSIKVSVRLGSRIVGP